MLEAVTGEDLNGDMSLRRMLPAQTWKLPP